MFGHIHEGWGGERVVWSPSENHGHENEHEHGEIESAGSKEERGGHDEWDDGYGEGSTVGKEERETIIVDTAKARQEGTVFLDLTEKGENPLRWGEETVFVNAAVVDVRYRPVNPLWVVDLDLMRR